MNEAVQPFMARTAQNYFVIKKENHRFECFMDQNFDQTSIADLGEAERKYKTTISVKVLGYLIGEGDNQEKPQVKITENAVEVKLPKENIILVGEASPRAKKIISSGLGNFSTPTASSIALKKTFMLGDGQNSVYTVQHGLNTRDVFISVREAFGDYDVVNVGIGFVDLNNITIDMGDIIEANTYSVTIIG
jgi:hypothetical protein